MMEMPAEIEPLTTISYASGRRGTDQTLPYAMDSSSPQDS